MCIHFTSPGVVSAYWVCTSLKFKDRYTHGSGHSQVGYGCQFLSSDMQWRLPLGLQVRVEILKRLRLRSYMT